MVKEHIANIGIPLDGFVVLRMFCNLRFCCVFGSLQTSLLGKVGELARGGSVAVAVALGVSDR